MEDAHASRCSRLLRVQRTGAEKFCYVAVPARMRAVIGARHKALSAMLCLCDSGARGKKSEELWQ